MNNKTIKILIADDHAIVLDGLEALIKPTEDIEVIGRAHNGYHTLQILELNSSNIDIVVLDIEMPVMDGIEATKRIKISYPDIKILILTMSNNASTIHEVIQAGVSGYILKNRGSNELLSAIRAIYNGEEYFSKSVTDTLIKSIQIKNRANKFSGPKLTKREAEVLKFIGQGLTSKQVAKNLHIATSTVETHRRNLLDKLGLKNSKELLRFAVANGYADSQKEREIDLDKALSKLTKREKEIFHLIVQGASDTEIVSILGIKEETVNKHRQNILDKFKKLGINNSKELIKLAVAKNYLKSDVEK